MGAVTNGQPSRAAINRGGVRPDIRVMIDTDLARPPNARRHSRIRDAPPNKSRWTTIR
jgi:hypothetical protein